MIVIIIALIALYVNQQNNVSMIFEVPSSTTKEMDLNTTTTVNSIATIKPNDIIYKDEKNKFQFHIPQGWYIMDNPNKTDTDILQLFNYQEPQVDEKLQSDKKNKIEVVVVENNPYQQTEDYPEIKHEITKINIAGRSASRIEIEYISGEQIIGYLIPLPNTKEKLLAITIYGDSINFFVLDTLITSIEWLQ